MRNRAKCKLCESIIESQDRNDYVTCSCGEISVDGGNEYHRCRASDWANFLRVDDDDNIIIPIIKEKETPPILNEEPVTPHWMTKDEALEKLREMAKRISDLPPEAIYAPINHADFCSLLLLLWEILKAKE